MQRSIRMAVARVLLASTAIATSVAPTSIYKPSSSGYTRSTSFTVRIDF